MASFHHSIKSGKKGSARRHSIYISREGSSSTREDLIHTGYGNLPDWAQGNPGYFWRMADKHERANGAAYREHEIALPNELTKEQLIELAERLVRNLVGGKPYQYAIHASEGSIGNLQNPHIHLMYSDRVLDGIDRAPDQMFSRFNAKAPETGGCRKDSGGKAPLQLRQEVTATRKLAAETQNHMLAEYGYAGRVDHRSLRERGIQRRVEHHLGPCFIDGMADAEKVQYAACRALLTPATLASKRDSSS